jgi:hypothetical protein
MGDGVAGGAGGIWQKAIRRRGSARREQWRS